MLSYKLTEIKLVDLKIYLSILKIQSQQKLPTKRVDSLSCNYPEKPLRLLLMRLNHKTMK